jgi:hypothetical protein
MGFNGVRAVTASDLRLLVDTDNDGIFSDETPISGATSVGGNIYQFAGVSTISNNRRFTLATIDRVETPLPIELISFEANVNESKVDLKWITATEVNNDYFTIERSENLKDWSEVVYVKGAGNSNQEISYFDVDYFPLQGISYYRLKQTDFDGKFSYSNVIPVNFATSNIAGTINLFPNPTQVGKSVNLEFKNIIETEILVVLRDVQGKEYYSKMVLNIEDGKLIGVPIETSIPAGIYLVTATSENQIYSQKLIIR